METGKVTKFIKNYRPEIDGLRAISIIVIVIYHLNISIFDTRIFPGGYLGVDVFLVISGYLIQRILGNYQPGTNLLKFYQRRILRIFPAMFFVLFITLPFAYFFLIPPSLLYYIKSAFASIFAISNFFFADTMAYNGEAASSNVLLHMWSLSLEEQFYLLFPALYFPLIKCKKSTHSAALLFLIITSLALTQVRIFAVGADFYLLPTRLFEFLIGAFISLNQEYLNRKLASISERFSIAKLNQQFSFCALIALFLCIMLFGDAEINPSFMTLIPVLAVAVLLLTADSRGLINSFLRLPPMVYIGLTSYSLYLYHQPIIIFTRMYFNSELNYSIILGMLIAMLVLSNLSYRFIEKPYRYQTRIFTYSNLILLVLLFSFFTSGIYIIRSAQIHERLEQAFLDATTFLRQNEKGCYARDPGNLCKIGNSVNPEFAFYLTGDSHAGTLELAIANSLDPERTSFTPINEGGCAFIPDLYLHDHRKNKYKCDQLNKQRMKVLAEETRPTILILSARWPCYFDGIVFDNQEGGNELGQTPSFFSDQDNKLPTPERIEFIKAQFKKFVTDLNHKGTKVVIVYPVPEVGWHVPGSVFNKKKLSVDLSDKTNWVTTSSEVYRTRNKLSYEILDSVPGEENLLRVYPSKLYCDTEVMGRCITHNAVDIFYSDVNHPSKIGAELIASKIVEGLKLKWNLQVFK